MCMSINQPVAVSEVVRTKVLGCVEVFAIVGLTNHSPYDQIWVLRLNS